jgi:hypothetical protein
MDGHRIEIIHRGEDDRGLTGSEVLALRYEQECLPGELAVFDKTPRDYPWEPRVVDT